MLSEPPVRLCCFERHWDVVCPDGRVMCQICFERVEQDQLGVDDGQKIDVCKPCLDHEQGVRNRMTAETLTASMPDRMADNIRALRRSRSWTQQELATKVSDLGVPMTRQVVAKIENRFRRVLATEMWALGRVFDLADSAELLMGQCSTCTGSPPPGMTCDHCGPGLP